MRWGEEGREEQHVGAGVFCLLIKGNIVGFKFFTFIPTFLLLLQNLINMENSLFSCIESFCTALSFVYYKDCSYSFKYL